MNRVARRMAPFVLVVLPSLVQAETYLCVVDAAAVVEDDGKGGQITASVARLARDKYVLSNASGKWQVKNLGDDFIWLDKCVTAYFCERSDGYAGIFMRDANGIFTATSISVEKGRNQLLAMKGRCSKL